MAIIYPSLIAADVLNLQKEIETLDTHCQGYHLDVMDYHFVPNLTCGPLFINAIARITYKQLWVHLMMDNPENFIDMLTLAPKTIVNFHVELEGQRSRLIKKIAEKGWLPGIAVSPKTDIEKVFPFLDRIHQVLVMSVEPGFSGQEFQPNSIEKVEKLVGYRQTSGLDFKIGMDGGIDENNIAMLAEKGVEHFGIGSGIFKADNPVEQLKKLQDLAKES